MSEQAEDLDLGEEGEEDFDQGAFEEEVLETSEEEQEGPSAEDRAKIYGWNPNGTLSAEEFVAKRDDDNGLLRSNIATAESKIDELSGQTREMSRMMAQMRKESREAKKQGLQRGLQQSEEQQRVAVEESDGDDFAKAKRLHDAYEKALADHDAEEAEFESEKAPEVNPIVAKANSFYEDNKDTFKSRKQIDEWQTEVAFQVQEKGLDLDEAFTVALTEVTGGKRRVPGGERGEGGRGGGGSKTFDSMPKDAKASFRTCLEDDPELTKEEFATAYWSQ